MSTTTLKPPADASAVKSIAAAQRLGYRFPLADHYGGDQLTVKGRTMVRNPFIARSTTAWARMGCTLVANAKPHATVTRGTNGGNTTYPVFRHDQVERRVVNIRTGYVVSVVQPEPVLDHRRTVMTQE